MKLRLKPGLESSHGKSGIYGLVSPLGFGVLIAQLPVYDSGGGCVGVRDGVLRIEDMHHFDPVHAQHRQ